MRSDFEAGLDDIVRQLSRICGPEKRVYTIILFDARGEPDQMMSNIDPGIMAKKLSLIGVELGDVVMVRDETD